MGINLAEGLRAASSGLQTMAGYYAQREQKAIEQLRAENLARLQNQLSMQRDEKLEEGRDRRAKLQQDSYFDRMEQSQSAQDRRQAAREAAADARATDREAVTMERDTRNAERQSSKDAGAERQKAIDDIRRIKTQLATYAKDKVGPLAGEGGAQSLSDLAENDDMARSLLYDLRAADQRRQQAEARMQAAPDPTATRRAAQTPAPNENPFGPRAPFSGPTLNLIPDDQGY